MLSEHVSGVLEHKRQVAHYLQKVVALLYQETVDYGDILPFHLEDDDGLTLLDLLDVAFQRKSGRLHTKSQVGPQLQGVIERTVQYLDGCREWTPCAWRGFIMQDVLARAIVHDDSKFSPEELEDFERATPRLKELTYGSEEYRAALREIKPAIEHHYAVNDHHPEHFPEGINGMHLVQLIEMVCDWIAATKRVKDGDLLKSMGINEERFGIEQQLAAMIWRTIEQLAEGEGK